MNKETLHKELNFKGIRSSGAGGQHVNKVSSKVVLTFNSSTSKGLSAGEKALLRKNLINKITKEGLLILTCQESRSQHKNKILVIKQFFKLLTKSLIIPKVRKKKKLSRSARQKRLNAKKRLSEKKNNRKNFNF